MRGLVARLLLMSPWVAVALFASTVWSAPTASEGDDVPLADGFDFPVGAPDGYGYYCAQGFGQNHHLGEDWNGSGGGNTDYGDPVYAIGTGVVSASADLSGGWGNVVRIIHRYEEDDGVREVESLYAHLQDYSVRVGDVVGRGQQIGRIGDADGIYIAHLHFEIRAAAGMPVGPGYARRSHGYLDPTAFIASHR